MWYLMSWINQLPSVRIVAQFVGWQTIFSELTIRDGAFESFIYTSKYIYI